MFRRNIVVAVALACACSVAGAEVFVGPRAPERGLGIVQNSSFESGGMSYASYWRPLPGAFRMHRTQREDGAHSLFLELRGAGDGGVTQTVSLPAHRNLSLRVLATCHADSECAVVATLTCVADGQVLCEVVVDGIERGVLAEAFETGAGGPAELMVRVVGDEGARALVDRVSIASPVEARYARSPDYSGEDLVLAPGQGLRVDADFDPGLLPQAARMLQEAIEDVTGRPTTEVGATVMVSVNEPQVTAWPERESYRLTVTDAGVTISAPSEQGAMWAMMTLIDLIRPEPDGGARVLAVNVQDQPALPWRIGSDHGLADAATVMNATRKLARLKLNMALVPRDETGTDADEVAVAALREVGIEPVVVISGDAECGATAAMEDALERLNARHLFVSPPLMDASDTGEPLPWAEAPLSEVAEFARQRRDTVTVIVPGAGRTTVDYGGHTAGVAGVTISFDGWPQHVVAAVYPSNTAEQGLDRLQRLDAAGIRSVVYHLEPLDGTSRALTARSTGMSCMGALIPGAGPEGADRAWRGLAREE